METRCKHALYLPEMSADGPQVVIEGDEARHAVRVKRVKAGQHVALLDGQGGKTITEVIEASRSLVLKVISQEHVPLAVPPIEVCSATPKGPRAGALIDLLSQTGADVWFPLETAFGTETVNSARRERLERVAVESLKQCGRAWLLELGRSMTMRAATEAASETDIVLADASGEPYAPCDGATTVRLLVGPEGGWRADELAGAIGAGARACRFGPHIMRIETAAAAATAIIRDAWNRH